MKPTLQLRVSQQLTLTPQLQQAIRLLQFSSMEMQQEVARMLEQNPMLEVADDSEAGIYQPGTQTPSDSQAATEKQEAAQEREASTSEGEGEMLDWQESGGSGHSASDDEDDMYPEQAAGEDSLRTHLHNQLATSTLPEHDRKVVGLLIDALDENGYLSLELQEIADLLPTELEISLDDLETALVQLQYLDQPGLGARNLSECLALQLKALPEDTPHRNLAIRLVCEHLDLVAAHDFNKIKRQTRCTDIELRDAQLLITTLNPKPGAAFNPAMADYVTPDVIVEKHRNKWVVRLNSEAMPKLRVNQMYASILSKQDGKNNSQMSTQLQEARWMIKNLQQRFDTILRVAQAIVERQTSFFEHGEIAMRPMIMREIAELLELHESTISRSTTQKFMLTPRGIFEFKHFFSSGLSTNAGGTCSSTAIRELIKQLVSAEDQRKPLTDSRMSEILAQQGIVVARRTIAKYRESLNILPVNLRKSL